MLNSQKVTDYKNLLNLSYLKVFYNEYQKPDEILLKYQDFKNIIDLIEDLEISNEIEKRLKESNEFVDIDKLESLKCLN